MVENVRRMELHDFDPSVEFRRQRLILISITLAFMIIFLILLGSSNFSEIWIAVVAWISFFGFAFSFTVTLVFLVQNKVPRLWDDYDYQNLVKTDFEFVARSTGRKHYAYIYTRDDVDINDISVARPTIIGLHGWGSHHREMDRYAIPSIREEGYIYFTYDAQGQGQTPGDLNDLDQFAEACDFINHVKKRDVYGCCEGLCLCIS